ncbi:hypothetical protein NDU88_006939 [Pleurodeles waltl]|uniref:Uncharacterized protein n=1 Tax=Pleurodeles waltl TaxID=8319 RepID=A0AAV7SRC9_PLEWA|nr:hypothetical protein NDU88_006939 [Pleurodeles waltl]
MRPSHWQRRASRWDSGRGQPEELGLFDNKGAFGASPSQSLEAQARCAGQRGPEWSARAPRHLPASVQSGASPDAQRQVQCVIQSEVQVPRSQCRVTAVPSAGLCQAVWCAHGKSGTEEPSIAPQTARHFPTTKASAVLRNSDVGSSISRHPLCYYRLPEV